MTALENLTKAITDLTVSVDAVVNGWNTGPTEAQVQAAADAVGAQNARLVALVTPPPGT